MSCDNFETMEELIDEFQKKLYRKNNGLMLTINLDATNDNLDIDITSIDIKLDTPKMKDKVTVILED